LYAELYLGANSPAAGAAWRASWPAGTCCRAARSTEHSVAACGRSANGARRSARPTLYRAAAIRNHTHYGPLCAAAWIRVSWATVRWSFRAVVSVPAGLWLPWGVVAYMRSGVGRDVELGVQLLSIDILRIRL